MTIDLFEILLIVSEIKIDVCIKASELNSSSIIGPESTRPEEGHNSLDENNDFEINTTTLTSFNT